MARHFCGPKKSCRICGLKAFFGTSLVGFREFLLVNLFFLASSLSNLRASVEEYQLIPARVFR
jgi:hypothetical protein